MKLQEGLGANWLSSAIYVTNSEPTGPSPLFLFFKWGEYL